MPDKTLELARSKALELSLIIAKMSKVSEIIDSVNELIEILTGESVFDGKPMMKPQPPPDPKVIILKEILQHSDGLTRHTLCKQTGLTPEIAQESIDDLVALGELEPVKRSGWQRYATPEQNGELQKL